MKTKEFEPIGVPSAGFERRRVKPRPAHNPGIGIALLGVACAAGVLGVLWLLYAFG